MSIHVAARSTLLANERWGVRWPVRIPALPFMAYSASSPPSLKPMFYFLFSCCGLRQRHHDTPVIPHERTPLIPATDDTPTPQPRIVDHQNLKDRLATVVRSQEGKMVNVNAQFPFNLHNKDLDEPSPSRSSRNVSGGTRTSSRQVSPSPHRSLQKSQSSTSIHHDTEDPTSFRHPRNTSRPPPVLNVRLVRPTVVANRNGTSTRGRPARHIESSRAVGVAESGLIVGTELGNEIGASGADTLDEERTPRAHARLSGWEERPCAAGADGSSEAEISEQFKIQDAGAVSRSWGD